MRRALAARAAALALALAAAGCGSADPPAERARALVPADALAYVQLSTDPERESDERFGEIARKFPTLRRLTDGLQQSVGGLEVRPWLGKEAALALLDSGRPAADTLVLLAVADRAKAQAAVRAARLQGIRTRFLDGFLALGSPRAVDAAAALAAGRGRALTLAGERPDDRVLTLHAPAAGVRRVLAAQAGALGAVGSALDDPLLRHVTVTVVPEEKGVRLHVRRARRGKPPETTFEPGLLERAPRESFAYLGLGAAAPVARAVPGLPVGPLVQTLRGEVALWAAPGLPFPEITVVARTADEARTRDALGRLFGALAEASAPPDAGAGQVPTLEQRRIGSVTASELRLAAGVALLGVVHRGRLVLSTSAGGIRRGTSGGGGGLREQDRFERVVAEVPDRAEALAYVDLSKLLTLGELAGLADAPALQAVRDDLRRVRAIGAIAEREGSDTIAELSLEIP